MAPPHNERPHSQSVCGRQSNYSSEPFSWPPEVITRALTATGVIPAVRAASEKNRAEWTSAVKRRADEAMAKSDSTQVRKCCPDESGLLFSNPSGYDRPWVHSRIVEQISLVKQVPEGEQSRTFRIVRKENKEINVIPSGLESLVLDAEFGRFILFEKIERNATQDGKVMRAVPFA